MIGSTMNLLAIIIIVLALAAAGAIIYAAWELSSDKKSAVDTAARLTNRPAPLPGDAQDRKPGGGFRNDHPES
jgi:flagellar basal body-associated protein FliL